MSYPPSPAQMSFINDLIAKRDVPSEMADTVRALLSTTDATSRQASGIIDTLKSFPYKPRPVAFAPGVPSPREAYLAAFEGVEDSKYAIPAVYLFASYPNLKINGDLLFLEVKTYQGKRYLNKLQGAPGDFVRTWIGDYETGTGILKFIAGRHVEFAGLFSQFFHVCGRCAAPLTDQKSRETGFGPECRKVFGL